MEIVQNIYLYGKIEEDEFIVYFPHKIKKCSREIKSLEGFFISQKPIIKKGEQGINPDWQCIMGEGQMKFFEERYKGRFIPFEK